MSNHEPKPRPLAMGKPASVSPDQEKEVLPPPDDGTSATPALEAALAYAQAGLYVYPVRQSGEHPKAPACAHGYKDATRDPAQIHQWWSPQSVLGVALRTGLVDDGPMKDRNLVVVDVDRAKSDGGADGEESLRRWLAGEFDGRSHKLPETLEQRTQSGGRHLFFLSSKEHGGTANPHLRIDVRGNGGGIVVAPTRITHADGTTGCYEWVGGFDAARIAEADDEVESLIDFVFDYRPGKPSGGGHKDERPRYVRPDHVPCGGRHGEVTSYAAHLRATGASEEVLCSKVFEFAKTVCEQPEGDELGTEEIMEIVLWALSKPAGPDRHGPVPPDEGGPQPEPPEEDAPTDEDDAVAAYVSEQMSKFEVFTENDRGKVEFHPDRLTNAMLYGMHACTIGGAPAVWNGTRYIYGPASLKYMIELACPKGSASANTGVLKKVLARLEVERRFDLPDPTLVRFENGVLDLGSGTFRPLGEYSWKERIPNEIPHPLDLEAPRSLLVDEWLDTLSDGNEDVRRNLLQVIFLCMTRFTHHEQAAVLTGDGANGKSKFIDVISHIVGEGNMSSLGLGRLGNRFEVGDLSGKLVNVSSDISSSYLSGDGAATWKQVTGSDPIKADVKGLDGFVFRPYCQLVIVCNQFPRIEGGIDKATSRRLAIIPFEHSFRDANGRYSADADPGIVQKVCKPESLAYLIRLAVEEGMAMLSEREFMIAPNHASADELHKMATDNSSVLAWAEYVGLKAEDLHMQRRQVMYDRYGAWCKKSALKPVASQRFTDEILVMFPRLGRAKVRAGRCRMSFAHDPMTACGIKHSALVKMAGKVQYNAFVDGPLYERERESGTTYFEVLSDRDTLTSYTVGVNDSRETHRVEEVNLGVWQIQESDLNTSNPDYGGALYSGAALNRMFDNLARYEE